MLDSSLTRRHFQKNSSPKHINHTHDLHRMLLMMTGIVLQICMSMRWKVRVALEEDFEEKRSAYQLLKSLIKQRPCAV
jgi:hypothetical protein